MLLAGLQDVFETVSEIPADLTAPPSGAGRDTRSVSDGAPAIDEQLARRLIDAQFPQLAGPADRARRRRRRGQPDVPARRRPLGAPAERRLVRAPGREGAALAARARAAASTADPRAGRARPRRARAIPTRGRCTAGWRGRPRAARGSRTSRRSPPTSPAFLVALARAPAAGGPGPGPHNFHRGGPLAYYEAEALEAIDALDGEIDAAAARACWDDAMRPPGRASRSGSTATSRPATCWCATAASPR